MPALSTTPESRDEMLLGATGWAAGSQIWNGITPALMPKPTKNSTNATACWLLDKCTAAVRKLAKAALPLTCINRAKPRSQREHRSRSCTQTVEFLKRSTSEPACLEESRILQRTHQRSRLPRRCRNKCNGRAQAFANLREKQARRPSRGQHSG